ncbi:MAG: BUG/TctC family periplasmic protein, partial [uncultured Acetobacteraceae bacterium]
ENHASRGARRRALRPRRGARRTPRPKHLARPPDPLGRGLPRRQRHRHADAPPLRAARARTRPTRDRGQPPRRQRRHRDRVRGARGAGRPHLVRAEHHQRRPKHLHHPPPALRPAEGLRAGRLRRRHRLHPGGAGVAPGARSPRPARLGQAPPRPAHLQPRQLLRPHRLRHDGAHGRRRDDGGAVPRRPGSVDGRDRRPHRQHLHRLPRRHPPDPRGQAAPARRDDRRRLPADARHPAGGGRAAGLRPVRLVRHDGAGRDPRAGGRPRQRRHEQSAELARIHRARRPPRLHPAPHGTGVVPRLPARADRDARPASAGSGAGAVGV